MATNSGLHDQYVNTLATSYLFRRINVSKTKKTKKTIQHQTNYPLKRTEKFHIKGVGILTAYVRGINLQILVLRREFRIVREGRE